MKPTLRFVATLSLSLVSLVLSSGPVFAHSDELITSPKAGSTVEAAKISISVEFAEELLTGDEAISHEVVITNSEGAIIPALCAIADGFALNTVAAIDQPGEYKVNWRTVSADGHPTSGDFSFSVVNNTGYDAASEPVDACIYAMATTGEVTPNGDSQTGMQPLSIVLIAVAVAAGGFALIRLFRAQALRRKNKSE